MNAPSEGALGRAAPDPGSADRAQKAEAARVEAERAASNEEDMRWVADFVAGDSTGFESLYNKYRERVFAILMRTLRDRDDALEATQEVFVKIHQALGRYQPTARFFTWAYRVTMNHAIDRIRRRKVRKEQLYDETFTEPRGDQRSQHERFERAGESLEAEEVRARIATAVESLGEKHRAVFLLYSYEGLGYAEIAETLEIPVGTVMSRLYHARRKLREQLPPDWDPGGPDRKRENYSRGTKKEENNE